MQHFVVAGDACFEPAQVCVRACLRVFVCAD